MFELDKIYEFQSVEKKWTLHELAITHNISAERVRQIETKAYSKLKKQLIHISKQKSDFFIKTN